MPTITDWIMVIITAVYVVATIVICIFNYKSAKASNNQVVESKRQFDESNRPHVFAGIEFVSEVFMCLYIENRGNDVASDINVLLDEDWLNLIKDNDYKEPLVELTQKPFMLAPGQKITRAFTWVIVGVRNSWLDVFNDHPLKVSVNYKRHNYDNSYTDAFVYDINLFRNMFNEKPENDKEIKEISKSLKAIADYSKKISDSTKSLEVKLKNR